MTPPAPAFFAADGDYFLPRSEAANPWFDNAIAGGPVSGLFGHIAEQKGLIGDGFEVSRITIDILGIVPAAPLTASIEPVRIGRQVRLNRVSLNHDGRIVAQALIQATRSMSTPPAPIMSNYPSPNAVAPGQFLATGPLQRIVRTRPLQGSVTQPGPGRVWLALDANIVDGIPASTFLKSCVFADFGNGVGSATMASEWSFANLDVGIHFLREPRGEWIMVDAETVATGNGHGLARSTMADEEGVFALATQTIFVAPGGLTPRMQLNAASAIA